MARYDERRKEGERRGFKGFHGPWISPYDDSFEEDDWFSYLRQNQIKNAGHDVPFPGSSWSYATGDSAFSDEKQGFFGKGPKGWKKSDETIHDEVCDVLYHSPYVDASGIEVFVVNGVVTLSGQVDSRAAKKEAERLVEYLPGVWDVHNELVVESF